MLERPGFDLRGDHELKVAFQEDADEQFRRVIGVQRAVGDELADAATLHDSVVVALNDL